jgi:hypothetical protein
MKTLSPVWFLKDPIDLEEKYYILLDFLKSVSQEIKKNNFHSPLRTVLSLSKELDHFYQYKTLENFLDENLSEEDLDLLDAYANGYFSDDEINEIDEIIKNSLRVLKKYAESGLKLLRNLEEQIKIHSLEVVTDNKKNGMVIFRSTTSNEIFTYWWNKTEIRLGEEVKKGIMMKPIYIPHDHYSMSYEFIMCEILVAAGVDSMEKFPCIIIEISETFNQSSEIFKIAKEKFLREIDPD